jgi:hypothetical protein
LIELLMLSTMALAAPTVWNTSFIAQGIRPGAKIGLEHVLRESEEAPVKRSLLIEPSLMGWYHWGNHTPLTVSGQLIYRRTSARGWSREALLGQGATYAINAGKTYVFDDSGEITSSRLAGRLMSATSIGFGLGRTRSELAWHIRPTLTMWAPYNSGIAPVFTVEIGVRRTWGEKG